MDHANVTRQEIKGNAMLQEDWTAGLESALLGVEGQMQ